MAIRLSAQSGKLPLGFEVTKHFEQERRAFLEDGEPLYGDDLDAQLASEGYGPHTVTLTGKYVVPGTDRRQLHTWSKEVTLFGPLDKDSLARAIHGTARNLTENYSPKDTIPELYITDITVSGEEEPPEEPPEEPEEPTPPEEPPEPPEPRTVYVDTKTGKYVSKETWQRSRAQLRGKGQGRYVRRRE